MIEQDHSLTRHLTREFQTVPMLTAKLKRAGRDRTTNGSVAEWYDRQVRGGFAEHTDAIPCKGAGTYSFMHGYRATAKLPEGDEAIEATKRHIETFRSTGDPDDALQADELQEDLDNGLTVYEGRYRDAFKRP